MMDDYQAVQDVYCYPETTVLRNKWNVSDAAKLAEIEDLYSRQRIAEIYAEHVVGGRKGFAHFKKIHQDIFQDVYKWAGKIRTVRVHKGTTTFSYPENIEAEAERIFGCLKEERFLRGLDKTQFVKRIAWYIGELNALHPFREGNGRTLRVFIWLVGIDAGWNLEFETVDQSQWLHACILSFQGNMLLLEELVDAIVSQIYNDE